MQQQKIKRQKAKGKEMICYNNHGFLEERLFFLVSCLVFLERVWRVVLLCR